MTFEGFVTILPCIKSVLQSHAARVRGGLRACSSSSSPRMEVGRNNQVVPRSEPEQCGPPTVPPVRL